MELRNRETNEVHRMAKNNDKQCPFCASQIPFDHFLDHLEVCSDTQMNAISSKNDGETEDFDTTASSLADEV